MWTDLRLAARALIRDRSFSLAALCTLTLGIAANATVFTIVNGIFLRDLPFSEPDRIVGIETRRIVDRETETIGVSYPDLLDLQANARLFDGIAGVSTETMNVADERRGAERYAGAYISASGFNLIGQRPLFGRDFMAADDRPDAEPVAILGYDIWQNRYAGDKAIVGRVIRINGRPATVIGVMPDGFAFPQVAALWQPLSRLSGPAMTDRGTRRLEAFGRRRADASNEQARADLESVMQGLGRLHPQTNGGTHAIVIPFRETMIGSVLLGIFSALLGAVGFLLLIACANVANLSLARGTARAREIALRLSLGASRARLVRHLLAESLLLSGIAGGIGLLLAGIGARLFLDNVASTNPPYFLQFPVDARVLGFVALLCTGTAVAFGLAPALHATRVRLSAMLNEGAHGATASRRAHRWTGGLVIVQLTLALVLLGGASVLGRNVVGQLTIDPGVDPTGLVTMQFELRADAYGTREARQGFYDRLDAQLAALPGIEASVARWAPMAGGGAERVSIEGRADATEREAQPRTTRIPVGPRYFDTLGLNATAGRTLTSDDARPGQLQAVVNEEFVARHFPDSQPLGARVRLSPRRGPDAAEWFTIVGVVPNVRQEEADPREIEDVVYTPSSVDPPANATILARSDLDLGAVVAAVRAEVRALDPDLPLFDIGALGDTIDEELVLMRVIVSMFAMFAVLAISLAATGLYALTAYTAAQRTREIGIRVALGARRQDVWWLVTRRAAAQTAIGLAFGLAGAAAISRVLQGIFASLGGQDSLTLGVVGGVVAVIGLAAAWAPARRAMQLNPVDVLRAD